MCGMYTVHIICTEILYENNIFQSNSTLLLTTKYFLGLFVQIWHCNSCSQDCVIRMFGGEGGRSLGRQDVQLHGGDPTVQTLDHLQCNLGLKKQTKGVKNVRIQMNWNLTATAQLLIISCHFIFCAWTYRVHKVIIESIAQLLDARCDFIKTNCLLASIWNTKT